MKTFLLLLAVGCAVTQSHAQSSELYRSWNQPQEPFRVVGNVYYVGPSGIGAYLIDTEDGLILLDGAFEESVPIILNNIETLGFDAANIKLLITSHAHLDHVGGIAALKELTGAKLLVNARDVKLMEAGGRGDFALGDAYTFPSVIVDSSLADGARVRLGSSVLTAHLTAGHTEGCTTWTMQVSEGDRELDVVFACSLSILDDVRLINEPSYPGIADDYRHSFDELNALPCDVFLTGHSFFFNLEDKLKQRAAGVDENPFVECDSFRKFVSDAEEAFDGRLKAEKAQTRPDGGDR